MVEIEFDLNQTTTVVHANLNEPFKDIINRYLNEIQLKSESVLFLSNGKNLSLKGTLESQMNQLNKESNSMKILVKLLDEPEKEEKLFKSKEIICPECHESCKIKIENGKFKFYDCINNPYNR